MAVLGLLPYLETIDRVAYVEYGWIAALETRRINPVVVGSIRPYINDGDILVAHSNGCAIAYELVLSGLTPKGLVLINGALIRDIQIPTGIEFVHCYWNPGDIVTIDAMVGADLHFVDPNWGDMGHAGYLGNDPRVFNPDCSKTPGLPQVLGHSAIFVDPWEAYIAQKIQGAL